MKGENGVSVRFLIGRSGTGKTALCLREIKGQLTEEPLKGPAIMYIVPDQMTFAMEYELVKAPELNGMVRAQVLSFSRLAWRVLQETGGISRKHLSSTGVHMMLRKIIDKKKHEFKVFVKASDKTGFIDHVEQMITEFKRYMVSPEELEGRYQSLLANDLSHEKALADKLHDMLLLYRELEKELANKYIDSEDYLKLLAEKIIESDYVKGAEIYIDGFHSFTPQEYEVIDSLMKTAQNITIAITADKPFHEHLPHELHLFHMTGMTYHKLAELARLNGHDIDEVTLTEMVRFQEEPSLIHLENYYESRPTKAYDEKPALTIAQAVNKRAEVEGIAREMKRLVRDEGARYRDMAVLIRDMNRYHDLIEQVFKDFEIPFFIDEKRSMLYHPLIEFIRSSFEVITGNWRYEAVFRCVKTELLYPQDVSKQKMREQMDVLENYCLSYGIQGSKWTANERWTYRRYYSLEDDYVKTDEEREMEELINDLREVIVPPIETLRKRLKRAKTGRKMAEALYLYLEELNVPEKLEVLSQEAEKEGRLIEAREHGQVWNAVMDLLDEFVEMMGDASISVSLFVDVLDAGMESMKFALVPPAIDQVLVASLDRSRFYGLKTTFLIGVNDGVLPAKPNDDGVLSDEDREQLFHSGLELAPTARRQLLDENFLIYLALTSAQNHLYVSYPLADEEGKALLPSVIIRRLNDLFPQVKETVFVNEPETMDEEEQLSFLVSPNVTLSLLTTQLQNWKKQYPIHDVWWEVYNFFMTNSKWKQHAIKVISSLFYKNEEKTLDKKVSRKLYGEHIQGSVSRMELFRRCPFSHFASHGLKLKERETFRLNAPDIGQLFHAALKQMSDRLKQLQLDWRDLTKNQCEKLSFDAVEQLAPKLQREILLSSNRHHYLKRKLQKIMTRASSILSDHARMSGFAPVEIELGFGKSQQLPPFRFTLQNGCTMEVIGRIDRVDKAESSQGTLLRIIDFKSSDKVLDLTEVYYGLALQMLTYLDIVISHSQEWLGVKATPAGVLYFHIHDPFIQTSGQVTDDVIEEEIFKSFKMNGLLLGEEEAVKLMDRTLEHGRSNIVAAGIKKTGGFYSYSSIASEQEFDVLRHHIRKEFIRIGSEITDGTVSISPYKLKDKKPCTYCSFKTICQFDESLEKNEYRTLKNMKAQEVLEIIRKEDGDE
nr:helicase-exonuclease AddAB subunit AddB [Bacillus sp. FJAT-47783]